MRRYDAETEYCLDNMVLFGEVSPDVVLACRMVNAPIPRMMDQVSEGTDWRHNLDLPEILPSEDISEPVMSPYLLEMMRKISDEWWNNAASKFDKQLVTLNILHNSNHLMMEAISRISEMAFTIYAKQNNIEMPRAFKIPNAHRENFINKMVSKYGDDAFIEGNGVSMNKNMFTEICRYYGLDKDLTKMFSRIEDTLDNMQYNGFVEYHDALLEDKRKKHDDILKQIEENEKVMLKDPAVRKKRKQRLKEQKAELKTAKKYIARGIKLYESLMGNKNIRTFINGETMVISGNLYDYHAKKNRDIFYNSIHYIPSVPYELSIYDKKGNYLAQGCVYFEDTPIIDQLIALSLYVRDAEDELELLDKINLFNVSEHYKDSELAKLKHVEGSEPIGMDIFEDETVFGNKEYDDLKATVTRQLKQQIEGEWCKIFQVNPLVMNYIMNPVCDIADDDKDFKNFLIDFSHQPLMQKALTCDTKMETSDVFAQDLAIQTRPARERGF